MTPSPRNAGFEDIVRARAYDLWEREGRPSGRDAEHWRISEEETRREFEQSDKPAKKAETEKPAGKKAAAKSTTPDKAVKQEVEPPKSAPAARKAVGKKG